VVWGGGGGGGASRREASTSPKLQELGWNRVCVCEVESKQCLTQSGTGNRGKM
jgi:hypothetical protein